MDNLWKTFSYSDIYVYEDSSGTVTYYTSDTKPAGLTFIGDFKGGLAAMNGLYGTTGTGAHPTGGQLSVLSEILYVQTYKLNETDGTYTPDTVTHNVFSDPSGQLALGTVVDIISADNEKIAGLSQTGGKQTFDNAFMTLYVYIDKSGNLQYTTYLPASSSYSTMSVMSDMATDTNVYDIDGNLYYSQASQVPSEDTYAYIASDGSLNYADKLSSVPASAISSLAVTAGQYVCIQGGQLVKSDNPISVQMQDGIVPSGDTYAYLASDGSLKFAATKAAVPSTATFSIQVSAGQYVYNIGSQLVVPASITLPSAVKQTAISYNLVSAGMYIYQLYPTGTSGVISHEFYVNSTSTSVVSQTQVIQHALDFWAAIKVNDDVRKYFNTSWGTSYDENTLFGDLSRKAKQDLFSRLYGYDPRVYWADYYVYQNNSNGDVTITDPVTGDTYTTYTDPITQQTAPITIYTSYDDLTGTEQGVVNYIAGIQQTTPYIDPSTAVSDFDAAIKYWAAIRANTDGALTDWKDLNGSTDSKGDDITASTDMALLTNKQLDALFAGPYRGVPLRGGSGRYRECMGLFQ